MARVDKWLTEEGLAQITEYMRRGNTEQMLAKNLIGCARDTLRVWRKKYPELQAAIDEGKVTPDDQVEAALFRRAIGMTVTEKTWGVAIDKNTGEERKVLIKEVTKQVPPDTKAALAWLYNRRREQWCERQAVAIETGEKISLEIGGEYGD